MLHVTSGLGLILEVGLAVFCFIDVLVSPEAAVRGMPRWGWILAILVFPLAGCAGWLVAGRHSRAQVRAAGKAAGADRATVRQASAPDAGSEPAGRRTEQPGRRTDQPADAGLVAELWAVNEEHERTLRAWEDDLRLREEALRSASGRSGPTSGPVDAEQGSAQGSALDAA